MGPRALDFNPGDGTHVSSAWCGGNKGPWSDSLALKSWMRDPVSDAAFLFIKRKLYAPLRSSQGLNSDSGNCCLRP